MEFSKFLKTIERRSMRKQNYILQDLPAIHGGFIKEEKVKKTSDLLSGIEGAIIRKYQVLLIPERLGDDLLKAVVPNEPINAALLMAKACGVNLVLNTKLIMSLENPKGFFNLP